MPKKKRRKKTPAADANVKTVIIKSLIGSAVGTALFFLLIVLASLIALKTDMPQKYFPIFVLLSGAVSGLVCGFTAVRPIKKNGLLLGAASCVIPYLIIIVVSVCLSHSGLGNYGWILLAVLALTSSFGGILAVNKRK
ncbi:MAG: TIGR04086 family membrane protein [Clostridia bacterium]|nr:TIGR04086 family membrane protein [Clostridia bacterium]